MHTVYFDSPVSDEVRRDRLYNGQLFLYSPRPSMLALCEHARQMIAAAFAPLDPTQAQHQLSVEEFVAIAASLKPSFIHHPKSKQLIQNILEEYGYDLEKTYFDVPRLKIITSHAYLTAGVGYPFHPHRDTWYCAPPSQVNWWLPVYEFESESSMAFHPKYWNQAVKNSSSGFNYYEYNNTGRKNAAQHVKKDTRFQPRAEEFVDIDPQVRLVCEVGGVLLFSGAQMHSTVPNTSGHTRFSIDFRTVHLDDLIAKQGAPNIDNASTGTALRDFMRATDLAQLPEEVVALYEDTPPPEGELVFQPPVALAAY